MADGLPDAPVLDSAATSGAAGARTAGPHDVLDDAARAVASRAARRDAEATDAPRAMSMERPAPDSRLSFFRGPCKAGCAPLARCCVSADGSMLCCCVPIGVDGGSVYTYRWDYILPLGLHMCLCPQQGCDPCPTSASGDQPKTVWRFNVAANLCGCCWQNSNNQAFAYTCCWKFACCHIGRELEQVCCCLPCGLVMGLIIEGR